jgi:hypothetical protein
MGITMVFPFGQPHGTALSVDKSMLENGVRSGETVAVDQEQVVVWVFVMLAE